MTAQNVNQSGEAKRPAGRRPGRPKGAADSAETRARLLDTALDLFASQGIAETSLNAIARAAGVTPAMLHYYFHSRDQLLDVIVEERFLPLRQRINNAFTEYPDDPRKALPAMVEELASQTRQNPWFARLWIQDVTGDARLLRQHFHAKVHHQKPGEAIAALQRWRAEGKINPHLAPELMFISLMSLILIPLILIGQPPVEGRPPLPDDGAIVNHALNLLLSGIYGQPDTE